MRHASTTGVTARHTQRTVLVTGASGYVGGRLVPELLAAGFTVKTTSRSAGSVERFAWRDNVEHITADLTSTEDIRRAAEGVDVLFYLVHSMGKAKDFEETEAEIARNVEEAAASAGVRQIVYLSGLFPDGAQLDDLSKHMRSRERVAQILIDGRTPAIVLRAATLIGSGSASFEIIRHLTERLPVMVAPQWINNRIEPISIRDALYYLVKCADLDTPANRGYDIGGGHVYQFKELLSLYAEQRGLKRRIATVPVALPMDTLSGLWIGLVTPVPASLGKPLAQSMAEDAVTANNDITALIPDPADGLTDYPTAVRRALARETDDEVVTSWDDSETRPEAQSAEPLPTDPDWSGQTVNKDERTHPVDSSPDALWTVIEGIGGRNGWYSAPVLWNIRGLLDRLVGGPGLGGRRDPRRLSTGDRVDWWRVESIDRGTRLVLRAEMKVSGKAWLILGAEANADGTSTYHQQAIYLPRGAAGHVYWWLMAPFHALIFPIMARNIASAAHDLESGDDQA